MDSPDRPTPPVIASYYFGHEGRFFSPMPLVPPLAPVDENSIPPSPDVMEPGCAIPSIEPRSRSPTRIRSLQDSADALLDRINVILVGFKASQDAGNAPIPSAAPAMAPVMAPAAVSSPGCPHCGNRFHKGAKCWFLTQPGTVPGSVVLPNMTPQNLSRFSKMNHPALPEGMTLISAASMPEGSVAETSLPARKPKKSKQKRPPRKTPA
ncbi:hypothetical protein BKA56DRAFT_227931 [Ilyonectria sp. MPI-CAGE-AT-0026]|nr:hypothetical protein BKA56DRAFT_227931 [Ilyonectria sp. MPI-CAGE-AT-0026]